MVGIAGEPGIGKSRVLEEFRQSLAGTPVTYCEGHCLSYGRTTPYLPVLDLLRQLCGITDADPPQVITAKLHQQLLVAGLDPAETAPTLLHLLGLTAGTEQVTMLSPEEHRARTFAILRQFSLQRSQRQPLILAVENLHWIDATSGDYLTSLVERLAGAPILLLATYRSGYRSPWLEKSYATQLALPGLTARDSLVVVQSVLQTTPLADPRQREGDHGGLVMSYYDVTDMPLGQLARQYTLCDHFFHSAFGGSWLNHMWLISARTPYWPEAPGDMVAQLDARGVLIPGTRQDAEVTPDGYAVNTVFPTHPPYPANVPSEGSVARMAGDLIQRGRRCRP